MVDSRSEGAGGVVLRRGPLRPGSAVRRALGVVTLSVALVMGAGVGSTTPSASAAAVLSDSSLYLVTLNGPGLAGYRGVLPIALRKLQLQRDQDLVLSAAGLPEPLYRWTTALNGFAVRLDADQAESLRSLPAVSLVEQNTLRHLAEVPTGSAPATGLGGSPEGRGGAGVVIGLVDSGLWPQSPLFSDVPGLGQPPRSFVGDCLEGPGWASGTCNRKVIGARWFVDGFGTDRLRTSSSLSARDDSGHGTQMASIAAGNAGVSVRVDDQRLGRYAGVAPQSRLAIYKACWTAPDPADDGCATADLVTAIDRATADGVDVLNLAVGGPNEFDTVERALLGAAEADVVVVAAAGNTGDRAYSAHVSPWVVTVGGTTGLARRGALEIAGGPELRGAMASRRGAGPAPLVLAAQVPAPQATRSEARVCLPGSLDAARVADAIVLCERGRIGRVDKSAAVARADGVGMVLTNVRKGPVQADFHSVPTVHLDRRSATALRAWRRQYPGAEVSLQTLGVDRAPARVTSWSASGDPAGAVIKPDVVAPGVGVLGAVPPSVRSTRWDLSSGTSTATAYTSGVAAVLRSRRPAWSADVVRSALATSSDRVAGAVLRSGAGRVRAGRAGSPGLALEVPPGDYRAWLTGQLPADALNTPSLLIAGDRSSLTRTVTNVGRRHMYFSSSTRGFSRHPVSVTPAALRLAPGESATFTVSVDRGGRRRPLDDGWILWRGANGSRVRVPVLVTR